MFWWFNLSTIYFTEETLFDAEKENKELKQRDEGSADSK